MGMRAIVIQYSINVCTSIVFRTYPEQDKFGTGLSVPDTSGQWQGQRNAGGRGDPRLWDHQVEAIIDIKLSDAESDSYKYEPMSALLARWETIKKYKHIKHCPN